MNPVSVQMWHLAVMRREEEIARAERHRQVKRLRSQLRAQRRLAAERSGTASAWRGLLARTVARVVLAPRPPRTTFPAPTK